jgi:hypothetical protein
MELLTPSYGLIFWTVCILLGLVTLVDVLIRRFKGRSEKLAWIVVVLLVPFLGAILYFVIGRKNRIKLNQY